MLQLGEVADYLFGLHSSYKGTPEQKDGVKNLKAVLQVNSPRSPCLSSMLSCVATAGVCTRLATCSQTQRQQRAQWAHTANCHTGHDRQLPLTAGYVTHVAFALTSL